MHDGIRLGLVEDGPQPVQFADVRSNELVAGMISHGRQILQVARVGELVNIGDLKRRVLKSESNEAGTNEPRAASNDDSH